MITRDGSSSSPGVDEFSINFDQNTWTYPGEITFSNGQGNRLVSSGQNTWVANTWYFIAITIDNSQGTKMYLDGIEVSSNPETTVINNIDNNTAVGRWGNVNIRYFNGAVDEIMMFDRALESCEIVSLYTNSELCSTTTGLWQQNTKNIFYNGNVAIGRSNVPSGFNFAVDGKIVTKEVKVTLDNWSDFVFKPDYYLMPIRQLEEFIIQNKHLPSIPTENDIKESGVILGEMDAKLLQKIEELTLYMIEQNKRIEKLEKENKLLKTKMNITQ